MPTTPVQRKPQAPTATLRSADVKKTLIVCLLVFAATFAAYLPTLKYGFIWDDKYLILNNYQVKDLSHAVNVFKTYAGYGSDNVNNFYRPLQELSNMVNYFFWKERAIGYHLTNNLLHASVAALTALLLISLTGDFMVALLAGTFFGVHAIHTEAVTYIAGRADPLYALFFLLALILFVRYLALKTTGRRTHGILIVSVLSFCLALLSKEISVILPLVILMYLSMVVRPSLPKESFRAVRNTWIPYAVIALMYGILRSSVLNFSAVAPHNILETLPLANRLLTFFTAIPVYLRLLVVPTGLHMERDLDVVRHLSEPNAFLSLVFVTGILAGAIYLYRRNRILSFFICWFFLNLLPVSNIYPINGMIAEHWIYMASISYFFFLAYALSWIYRKTGATRMALVGIALLGMVITIFYAHLTMQRNRDWKDPLTFFKNTLIYSAGNARLHLSLGNTYFEQKEFRKAIDEFKIAVSLKNDYEMAYSNLGTAYFFAGDIAAAQKNLQKAAQLKPVFPFVHYMLGLIYNYGAQSSAAIEELKTALAQNPRYYTALNALGRIYMARRDTQNAANMFTRSLKIAPGQKDIEKVLSSISNSSKK